MEEMRQSPQMVFIQHSGLKTADWGSVPHHQSSISHQAWGLRKMESAKKARECGGGEAA